MGHAPGTAGGDRRLSAVRDNPGPVGRLRAVVTYLEMRQAPAASPPGPLLLAEGAVVSRVDRPSVASYRFLYEGVGEPWLWHERRRLSDAALAALIHHPEVEILVLAVDGRVAGFAELDGRRAPDLKLAYFGLLPRFFGRGLGPGLLQQAIARAWSDKPRRLLVNTCTLDHPAALPLYRRFGFEPVAEVVRLFPDPRLTGVLPRSAAPQIPLAEPAYE